MKAYNINKNEVIKKISNQGGLSQIEVQNSRRKYGANSMTKKGRKSLFKRVIDALFEPMLIILEIAFVITLGVNIADVLSGNQGDFYECIGIFFAISLSVILTVVMEGKSQKAFTMLGKIYDNALVKVKRDGKIDLIPQSQIVVGDLVILESGDKVFADGRLISSTSMLVDESMLTGESKPVEKNADVVLREETPLAERINCVYSGTFILNGNGEMVVTSVGDNAEIGEIASEIQAESAISAPLQEKLDRLSKLVAILGSVASIFVFTLSIIKLIVTKNVTFTTVEQAFLDGIILIVASVPEGLATTVAITLTLNVVKLYKSNALIKKLVAAETVGCVSVICSDKTGTLTENKMKVKRVVESSLSKDAKSLIEQNIALNSTAEILTQKQEITKIGAPTECALLEYLISKKVDYKAVRSKAKFKTIEPFNSQNKYMLTEKKTTSKSIYLLKGAPEIVLDKCNVIDVVKYSILNEISKEQNNLSRVIAFAHSDDKKEYVFDGYAVISDVIRKDVYSSVLECKNAGISLKMLTGDNFKTAFSIAKELEIANDESQVISGYDVERISDEKLKSILPNISVVARSTPATKLRVVKLLKEMGEVVAVTGDGVNDAPAIKHADIGISMGAGSEITKEASDIVLLDNSFSTIVKAISFGRNIYQNFQRFITFQLSVNMTAVAFIIFSMILGFENPFSALQLLWINLIMDGPPALTLALENRGFELMNNKPIKRKDNIVNKKLLVKILAHSAYMCIALVLQYKTNYIGAEVGQMKTVIFNLFIMFNLFNAFNCREVGSKSIFKNLSTNKPMLIVFFVTFILQILLSQFTGKFFSTVPLSAVCWIKIMLVSFSIIITSEIYKIAFRTLISKRVNKYKKLLIKM